MNKVNMFEYAVRNKLRFPFKGNISVEDLWDLSLTNLDSVYKTLNKQRKVNEEESLLETKSKADVTLEIQIEIIKYIVGVKKQEAANKILAKEKKEKQQKILGIMAKREEAALENASDEDLLKMLAELDD